MALDIRAYRDEDFDAVARIWREVRWIDDEDREKEGLRWYLGGGNAEVGLLDGEAECMVHRTAGTIRYDRTALPLSAVTGVTTSQIARKQRLASTMTARALQRGADEGAAVSALGMFEQGFYDRFGFGTGSYMHQVTFDPSKLHVGHVPYRRPVRLTLDDAAEMQTSLNARLVSHGGITLDAPNLMEAELRWTEHLFALGYRDEAGELTHYFAGSLKDENGPFVVNLFVYRTTDQLLELLRLFRELSDQYHWVKMAEPAHAQLQALIEAPIRERSRTRRTEAENSIFTLAWWQLRVLDLAACVSARSWPGDPVVFNLELSDPVTPFLEGAPGSWTGISGDYTVTIGSTSTINDGHDAGAPTVSCGVGAFSRLWFGICPASSLAVTDDFSAPAELTEALDDALRLPPCVPGMYF